MNVKLLEAICTAIEKHPAHFGMDSWFINGWEFVDPKTGVPQLKNILDGRNHCKTTACIAGWALVLTNVTPPDEKIATAAAELLGITDEQASYLFYVEVWPSQFVQLDGDDEAYPVTPQEAVARIRHFIATDGAE